MELDLFSQKQAINKTQVHIKQAVSERLFNVVVKKVVYTGEQGFVIVNVEFSKDLHALFPHYKFSVNPYNFKTNKSFTVSGALGYVPQVGETLSIGRLTLEKANKAQYADTIKAGIMGSEVVAQVTEAGEVLIDEKYLTLENTCAYIGKSINVKGLGEVRAKNLILSYLKENKLEGKEGLRKWYELAIQTPDLFADEMMKVNPHKAFGHQDFLDLATYIGAKSDSLELDLFLQQHGISPSIQTKIKAKYGLTAAQKVKRNPYVLADLHGVGFKKADEIALSLGLDPYSSQRLSASMYAFYQLKTQQTGDTSINCRTFLEEWLADLGFPIDIEHRFLLASIMTAAFASRTNFSRFPLLDKDNAQVVDENGKPQYCFTSARDLKVDESTRELLRERWKYAHKITGAQMTRLERIIHRQEQVGGRAITFDSSQINAIYEVLKNPIACLTGGAGCGKTTILKRIIECATFLRMKVVLCSPTGKAAKRMSESTGYHADTIHRLIGFRGTVDSAAKENNEGKEDLGSRSIDADWLFVDESSMIDSRLALALLKQVRNGTRITFIGDPNQLPPVGKGCFFYDIIDSGRVPVARLTKTHRQANGNDINDVAQAILTGSPKNLMLSSRQNVRYQDFEHLKNNAQGGEMTQQELSEKMQQAIVNKFEQLQRAHGLSNVLIITAKRQSTLLSSDVLNQRIRKRLFAGAEKLHKGHFYKNERVMGTVNKRAKDEQSTSFIFNGEMGTVVKNTDQELWVLIDGENVPRDLTEFRDTLALGYAITVHKSQGSEAKYILTALSTSDYIMLNREWFYTNVTRGKEGVFIYGQAMAVSRAVKNTQSRRQSLLRHLLNGLKPDRVELNDKMRKAIKSKIVQLDNCID